MAAIPLLLLQRSYASELPQSLLSSQVFKLAKAAFIVCFGISHLVRTPDVENNTNSQQVRMRKARDIFLSSCLKESHYPSKNPKWLNQGILYIITETSCFVQTRTLNDIDKLASLLNGNSHSQCPLIGRSVSFLYSGNHLSHVLQKSRNQNTHLKSLI